MADDTVEDVSLDDESVDWAAFDDFDEGSADEFESDIHGLTASPVDETTAAAESVDVSNEHKKYNSVSEVLGQRVGVQVRTMGGPGTYSVASIRGADAPQVAIYLDGILLNSGGFSSVDLGDLSLDGLERIDVYRGTTPVSLGLGSIGGAISLQSRKAEGTSTELVAGAGSWGAKKATAFHRATHGKVNLLLILGVAGAKGDFEYLNTKGTWLTDDDDEVMRRENNDYVGVSALTKLSTKIGRSKVTFFNDLYVKDQGVASGETIPGATATLKSLRELAAIQGERFFNENHAFLWSLSYMFQQSVFYDPDSTLGVGHQNQRLRANTASGFGVWRYLGKKSIQFDVRLESKVGTFVAEDFLSSDGPQPGVRYQLGSGLEIRWSPVKGVHVVPSVRYLYEHTSSELPPAMGQRDSQSILRNDHYVLPSVGVRWQLSSRHTFLTNVGRYVRTPDLFEMFGDRGSTTGNSDLIAEKGFNADAGMKYDFERGTGFFKTARAYMGVFGSWSDDLIAYVHNSQDTVRAANISSARTLGLELSLNVSLWSWLMLEGNYTYMESINRSRRPEYWENRLPGRPAHEAYAKISLRHQLSQWKGSLWADGEIVGDNFTDEANLHHDVLGRALLGSGLQMEYLPARLTLTFEIKNLLNTIQVEDEDKDNGVRMRSLRDYSSFPLPGRTIFATLHWKV
ncbi:MAG: TonB-dependent receptor [Deltaproteobacteria bacterium]|nr:TonB-dependent receptor [Deltaproteobacteria bacterium]